MGLKQHKRQKPKVLKINFIIPLKLGIYIFHSQLGIHVTKIVWRKCFGKDIYNLKRRSYRKQLENELVDSHPSARAQTPKTNQ